MRQGQHNKRARGRNRKGPNPLNRTYESNGPDVKIRGTAATVAEKYMALARDAQSSGDSVAAENYLQHAEHYNRIIAAAQTQSQPAQSAEQAPAMNGHDESASSSDRRDASAEDVKVNGAGRHGEQPEIEGFAREASEASENGSADNQGSDGAGRASRRPRRAPRRPRNPVEMSGGEPVAESTPSQVPSAETPPPEGSGAHQNAGNGADKDAPLTTASNEETAPGDTGDIFKA